MRDAGCGMRDARVSHPASRIPYFVFRLRLTDSSPLSRCHHRYRERHRERLEPAEAEPAAGVAPPAIGGGLLAHPAGVLAAGADLRPDEHFARDLDGRR